jgi:hypothetical protein
VKAQRIHGVSNPSPIDIDLSANTSVAGIGVADDGTAIAVWTKNNGGRSDLYWSLRLGPTGSWSSPALLEVDDTGSVGSVHFAVNAAGYAVVAWNQFDSLTPPFRLNVFARAYAPSSGWGVVQSLESRAETAEPPYVAISPNGNAVATWVQVAAGTSLWGSYYTLGAWTAPAPLDASATVGVPVIDGDGHAAVLWHGPSLRRYDPSNGWLASETFGGTPGFPRACASRNGEALVVWPDVVGGATELRIASLSTIDSPQVAASTIATGVSAAACGRDPAGRTSVFWLEDVGGRSALAASRFDGSTWGVTQHVGIDDVATVTGVTAVDVGSQGESVLVFLRFDGVGDELWSALLR